MSVALTQNELKELYNKDFPLWVEINANLLREGKYDKVDWENLIEEIEDMGLRHLEACISYLAIILEHLYKWDYLKDIADKTANEGRGGHKWIKSIENSRIKLKALYRKYPSLKYKTPAEIDKAWIDAKAELEVWLNDNGYSPEQFNIPEDCPYTYEEAMNRDLRKES